MKEKNYKILLNDKLLGTTKLEFGDPSMGVVFGQIHFAENNIGYNFFKKYCHDNAIEIQTDYPNDMIIATGQIEKLKIFNSHDIELIGLGNNIEGMDNYSYTITIIGLDHEVYAKEFPEHIAAYEQKFNS